MNQVSNKIVKFTGKPPRAGAGRPKGALNKLPSALKDMILQALTDEGGVAYLRKQANAQPAAFLSLIGKVLPTQVTGEGGGPLTIITKIELVAPSDDNSQA